MTEGKDTMPAATDFGARLTVLREQHQWSQEAFAAALGPGWSQSDVSKVERGTKRLDIWQLYRLAQVLQVSMDQLFAHDPAPLPLPVLSPALRTLLRIAAPLSPRALRIVTAVAREVSKELADQPPPPVP